MEAMRTRKVKRILVSVPTATHTQRLLLEGILRYAKEKRGDAWMLQLDIGGFARQRLHDLPGWNCDGVIAYLDNPRMRKNALSFRLPTVLIEPYPPVCRTRRADVVSFVCDYAGEGETAARHFLERHFKSFACIGTAEPTPWGERRCAGFAAAVRRAGRPCAVYPSLSSAELNDFALEMPQLMKWLQALPRPTALFVAHDIRARQVLTAANAAGISVPHHLAVLSVDNDELVCETATPPLSSIPTGDLSLGYACGRALEELICKRASGRTIVTRHTRVVSRASTDLTACDDALVSQTLTWARSHLSEDLSADKLARRINYSKRMLQIRTQKALGTTLGDEIRKMRLSSAADLLVNTKLPVADIAAACGFTNVSHLSMRLLQAYHLTPLALRQTS